MPRPKLFRSRIAANGFQQRSNPITVNTETIYPVLYDQNNKIMHAHGDATMSNLNSQSEFAKGCIFIKTDAGAGTEGMYRNVGTAASSTFEAIDTIIAGEIALAEGNMFIGSAGGVASALDIGNTDTGIAIGNGTTATIAALSGDVTMANTGATTLASADLETATLTNIVDTEILIGTGAGTANYAVMSGDVTLANTGATTLASADLETATLTNIVDTEILIGTGAGTANYAVLSGDVTLANTGATTLASADLETATLTNIVDTELLIGTGAGTANYAVLSGDVTLANTGATTLAAADLETATLTNIVDTELLIGTGAGTANYAVMSGDATLANTGAITAKAGLKTDLVTVGLPGTVGAFALTFNNETETEQTAALCKSYDHGTTAYVNIATSSGSGEYTANYQLFPDTETEDDAVYFGGVLPFGMIVIDIDTVATYGADSLTWEYYNGTAWTALTIVYDRTDSTAQDGLRSFQIDGHIIFSAPTDWTALEVDSQTAYWIRARCNATVNITQTPTTNSVEHKLVSDTTAPEMPAAGSIGRGRLTFTTNSASNNDTNIILCNLTSGACSAIKALTKAVQIHEIADFALAVVADDALAVYITQIDGATEFADGTLEMNVAKT